MSKTFTIDITKLTPAHFEEAENSGSSCDYEGPCILGTLLTPEERVQLNHSAGEDEDSNGIADDIKSGLIIAAEGLADETVDLQEAFDSRHFNTKGYAYAKANILKRNGYKEQANAD